MVTISIEKKNKFNCVLKTRMYIFCHTFGLTFVDNARVSKVLPEGMHNKQQCAKREIAQKSIYINKQIGAFLHKCDLRYLIEKPYS